MSKNCVFCDIAQHQLEAYIIYEDKTAICFLDRRPLFHGHALLIPKQHIETLYDADPQTIANLFQLTQKIGKAIEQATEAQGSFIANNNKVSQSVPHFHIHIVPRNVGDGLKGFFWPRTQYKDSQEMQIVTNKIKAFL